MSKSVWQIYLAEIPYAENKSFWVSFESNPQLKKTRSNIYGRCLPCIQNLYFQLQADCREVQLGSAFNCWKVSVVLEDIDQCLLLLERFQTLYPQGHVYGKLGSGRSDSQTKVVVFHVDTKSERSRIREALRHCLAAMELPERILVSRGCAVLFESLLGDWRKWQPTTPILHPERVKEQLARIRKILFWSAM